jgi:aspartokinase/homoserine dehydrogenase 1
MRVMKFGGTSVATAERLARAASLVAEAATKPVVVVVSALAGVTDALVSLFERAERGCPFDEPLESLSRRHLDILRDLGTDSTGFRALALVTRELAGHLEEVRSRTAHLEAARDAVLAAGERMSLVLASRACEVAGLRVVPWDARSLVRTDSRFGEAAVDFPATAAALTAAGRRLPTGTVAVAAGFIGGDTAGRTTTLGRGGSDYTAGLFGAALGADAIEIWTDVDGILSAPPGASVVGWTIPFLDYEEAFDLARFGGKVLHPKTMVPAQRSGVPIAVRNTFRPAVAGTAIGPVDGSRPPSVKAVSVLDNATLAGLPEGHPGESPALSMGGLACHGPGVFPSMWVLPPDARSEVGTLRPTAVHHGVAVVAIIGRCVHDTSSRLAAARSALRNGRVPILATLDTRSRASVAVVVPRGLRDEAVRLLHRSLVEPLDPGLTAAVDGR